MRILDLFCGAGGASMGYHQAFPDAEIVGVDIVEQPEYPFTFVLGDALAADVEGFDFVHASPPCQAFSTITPTVHSHVDLIAATRSRIQHLPYVIENVPQAPLRRDLMLCGSMFGMQVQRHRMFEHNLGLILAPACNHKAWRDNGRPWTCTGEGGACSTEHSQKPGPISEWQELMGMPWVTKKKSIAEAIPPAYTRWIGEHL
ncbi:hypothetical protein LCGC14_1052820 [marine sediment metagenome]|uniref:DNA (cytosine-5-)-methyltransferase n=1 Tax=marine sediment metagenome TaxID=412755 RepID=A0A0F9QUE7_9ZZZZ